MEISCSRCDADMTPPKDECKCKERCSECRSMYLEYDGTLNHKEGCSLIPNHNEVRLDDAELRIDQMGSIEGDSYTGYDTGFYIYSPKYKTKKDVELLLEKINSFTPEGDGN